NSLNSNINLIEEKISRLSSKQYLDFKSLKSLDQQNEHEISQPNNLSLFNTNVDLNSNYLSPRNSFNNSQNSRHSSKSNKSKNSGLLSVQEIVDQESDVKIVTKESVYEKLTENNDSKSNNINLMKNKDDSVGENLQKAEEKQPDKPLNVRYPTKLRQAKVKNPNKEAQKKKKSLNDLSENLKENIKKNSEEKKLNLNNQKNRNLNQPITNLNNIGQEIKNENLTDKLDSYIDDYEDINRGRSVSPKIEPDLNSLRNEEFNLDFKKLAQFDDNGDHNIRTISNEPAKINKFMPKNLNFLNFDLNITRAFTFSYYTLPLNYIKFNRKLILIKENIDIIKRLVCVGKPSKKSQMKPFQSLNQEIKFYENLFEKLHNGKKSKDSPIKIKGDLFYLIYALLDDILKLANGLDENFQIGGLCPNEIFLLK
ncbi:unnamed protein product, partial [Brachionus calyciflorus]